MESSLMVFRLSLPIQHYIEFSKSFIVKRRSKVVHAHSQYLSCCFTEVHSEYGVCQYTPTYIQRVVHVPMCSVTLCQRIVMLCALSGAMSGSLMHICWQIWNTLVLYSPSYTNMGGTELCWGGGTVQQCCSVSKHSYALGIPLFYVMLPDCER